MGPDVSVMAVLGKYPPDCHARRAAPLGGSGGFSGSSLWRIEASRGEVCLRRWSAEHPSCERLTFIHAVLRHAWMEGFRRLPLPIASLGGATFVEHGGRLWELAPWMPGEIDTTEGTAGLNPAARTARVAAALTALAEFHVAAATFPLSEARLGASPGLIERHDRLERLLTGELDELAKCLDDVVWPDLAERGRRYLSLFQQAAPAVRPLLEYAAGVCVALQPCLRDIWRENVLFVGDDVSAILDFGAMRVDTVAGDIARLLGSFANSDDELWEHGLAAYRGIRRLSAAEETLVVIFDRSSALLTGISWLDWVFRQRRQFADRAAVVKRFELALARLNLLMAPAP